ncbi:hypothetical protein EG68_05209 [Paragonimus skrjabini miyazakii]|uniref:Uncharacterized protein n=1 Tax=Paragonimus skrjabini miyazakii TaxID=59628 RepID=A0A8S9Z495_9TREM|nr:hypothetical protein EG68_05209 [Paragonimus skrjabini miyazakii]
MVGVYLSLAVLMSISELFIVPTVDARLTAAMRERCIGLCGVGADTDKSRWLCQGTCFAMGQFTDCLAGCAGGTGNKRRCCSTCLHNSEMISPFFHCHKCCSHFDTPTKKRPRRKGNRRPSREIRRRC